MLRSIVSFVAIFALVSACDDEPRRVIPPTSNDASIPLDSGQQMGDCAANPSGCEAGRLVGAAPTCECLPGCRAGFFWTGTMCVPTTSDAGHAGDDASVSDDASARADATAGSDGAVGDTGQLGADVPELDDAAVGPLDMGGSAGDASAGTDAGNTGTDAGIADSGTMVGLDAGGPADFGFGIGLGEGEQCDPAFNDCRQRPGLVCQAVNATQGICMAACDEAMNNPGTLDNAACTGQGRHCYDLFNLGASSARCINGVEPFAEYGRTVLDVCAPGSQNTFRVPSSQGAPTGLCVPLCTVELSASAPRNVSCGDPRYMNCDERQRRFQDGQGNFFGVCTATVTRGAHCEQLKGSACETDDLCFFGRCRQIIGATCTSTTVCSQAGTECLQQGLQNGGSRALCHEPCTMLDSSTCSPGGACTVTSTGAQPNLSVLGTCRARTSSQAHGQTCADTIGAAVNQYDCDGASVCLPANGATGPDWRQAQCRALCDPADPTRVMCPAASMCRSFNAPFAEYGVCL